jgi:hypothetical protein
MGLSIADCERTNIPTNNSPVRLLYLEPAPQRTILNVSRLLFSTDFALAKTESWPRRPSSSKRTAYHRSQKLRRLTILSIRSTEYGSRVTYTHVYERIFITNLGFLPNGPANEGLPQHQKTRTAFAITADWGVAPK